jgi:hypothetical protein
VPCGIEGFDAIVADKYKYSEGKKSIMWKMGNLKLSFG